jgi:hypothetical protein
MLSTGQIMNTPIVCLIRFVTLAADFTLGALVSPAEEGGSGHYAPGATSDFIDTMPGRPALVLADAFTY